MKTRARLSDAGGEQVEAGLRGWLTRLDFEQKSPKHQFMRNLYYDIMLIDAKVWRSMDRNASESFRIVLLFLQKAIRIITK